MRIPQSAGAWISKPSSPEKVIRKTRTGAPAMVVSRAPMKGSSRACSRPPSSTAATSTSRLRGPARAIPAHWSVTSTMLTSSSGHTVWAWNSMWRKTSRCSPVVVVM